MKNRITLPTIENKKLLVLIFILSLLVLNGVLLYLDITTELSEASLFILKICFISTENNYLNVKTTTT